MGTRSLVNSLKVGPHLPGMEGAVLRLTLPGPQALLMHQALGAVLHVIRGMHFEEQIGLSAELLTSMLEDFQVWVDACEYDSDGVIVVTDFVAGFEKDLDPVQIRALRNSLEVAMLDLGQSEFFTITGFTLAQGKQLLDVLNTALLGPLHLDQQIDPVSH